MRFRIERDRPSAILLRCFSTKHYNEIAYAILGLRGLQCEIEFPSDWHEEKRGWFRLGLGLGKLAVSFPWYRAVPDEGQCSGPTYGFNFFGDGLHLHWGKSHGKRGDPFTIVPMPWQWRHRKQELLTDKESHPYIYTLRSGEVQSRIATIYSERRIWSRPWLPWQRVVRSIWVEFDGEVGERTGSWKGGALGCGYDMIAGETPCQTLRRMERERKFT